MPDKLTAPLVFALAAAFATASLAEPAAGPDGDPARYSMLPVEGGVVRLDRETGEVTMCTRKAAVWSCDRLAANTGTDTAAALARLQRENDDLKARLKALEDAAPGAAAPPPSAGPQLPTEEEVDQALDYVERMFKKFRDRVKRLDEPEQPSEPDKTPAPAPAPDSKQL